ncbi:hypothetical protein Tco_0960417, partial [Tanacetum coccineum]
NMNPVVVQQVALDNALVAPEKRLKIETICSILPNQDFVELPSEDEMVLFIQELGYSGKCIFGKTTGLDRFKESRA